MTREALCDRQIVNLLPETVDLTEVNYGNQSTTINGIAPDEAGIFRYARDLRSSGQFSLVVILSIKYNPIIGETTEEEEEEEIPQFDFEFLLK